MAYSSSMEPYLFTLSPNFLIYHVPTVGGIIPSKLIETLSVSIETGLKLITKRKVINKYALFMLFYLTVMCKVLETQIYYSFVH